MKPYHNPWIPAAALKLLEDERGTILDVGGGAAPYYRASHVIDIQPYDAERLKRNAWGASPAVAGDETTDCRPQTADLGGDGGAWCQRGDGESKKMKVESRKREEGETVEGKLQLPEKKSLQSAVCGLQSAQDYTQLDICNGERWPFEDKQFDLGLSSHCLEDIRDPIQVVKEMARCCQRVLVICPSRLFEQMRGVDHPRYCGMAHHLWLVSEHNGELQFRRKTQLIEFPGMHLKLPPGKRLKTEAGSMCYYSDRPAAKEVMHFSHADDLRDYAEFAAAHRDLTPHLEADPQWKNWRRWWWYARQQWRWEV